MVWPFADIPPPPPEILETGIVMPSPLATIVGGTFLAFGMILLGRVLLRSKPAALQRKLLIGMGVVFFCPHIADDRVVLKCLWNVSRATTELATTGPDSRTDTP